MHLFTLADCIVFATFCGGIRERRFRCVEVECCVIPFLASLLQSAFLKNLLCSTPPAVRTRRALQRRGRDNPHPRRQCCQVHRNFCRGYLSWEHRNLYSNGPRDWILRSPSVAGPDGRPCTQGSGSRSKDSASNLRMPDVLERMNRVRTATHVTSMMGVSSRNQV